MPLGAHAVVARPALSLLSRLLLEDGTSLLLLEDGTSHLLLEASN